MDEVKEAFLRVKGDINFLYSELSIIKGEIKDIKDLLNNIQNKGLNDVSTHTFNNSINFPYSSTDSTHIKPLTPQILGVSNGNVGVPTDRQTNQQTNQQTIESSYNQEKQQNNTINNAIKILDSLDDLKKEIRIKFKRLTDQEMTVFSLLYQISEEKGYSDYKTLSGKLGLTESSIRDYIGRIIKKGIPVEKTKINNKTIHLSISENLKKIATLPTILKLRDI